VLAQLAAEVGEDLVAILQLDAKVSRGQHFDDAPWNSMCSSRPIGGGNLTR
jgi:hypothetical protein